jgi:hypothetical protein
MLNSHKFGTVTWKRALNGTPFQPLNVIWNSIFSATSVIMQCCFFQESVQSACMCAESNETTKILKGVSGVIRSSRYDYMIHSAPGVKLKTTTTIYMPCCSYCIEEGLKRSSTHLTCKHIAN